MDEWIKDLFLSTIPLPSLVENRKFWKKGDHFTEKRVDGERMKKIGQNRETTTALIGNEPK